MTKYIRTGLGKNTIPAVNRSSANEETASDGFALARGRSLLKGEFEDGQSDRILPGAKALASKWHAAVSNA